MTGLKAASRRFLEESLSLLQEKSDGHTGGTGGIPTWQARGHNQFALREPQYTATGACLSSEEPRLAPDRVGLVRLRKALSEDTRTKGKIDTLVGSPVRASRVDAESFGRGLIWRFVGAKGSFEFDEAVFGREYERALGAITKKDDHVEYLLPLTGITFAGNLRLDAGLLLGQLDDDEVSTCLLFGAMASEGGFMGHAFVSDRTAIKVVVRDPWGVDDLFSDAQRRAAQARQMAVPERAEDLLRALRVFKRGRVALQGQFPRRVVLHPDGSTGSEWPIRPGPPLVLSAAQARRFGRFWPLYKKATKHDGLASAVRRFGFAGERNRLADEIFDLVSSLESLVLMGSGDTSELSTRVALRAAWMIGGKDQAAVHLMLRRAYKVRSAVAHGNTPKNSDLRGTHGQQLSITEFAEQIEGLVRTAFQKALLGHAAGVASPINWEAEIVAGMRSPWGRFARRAADGGNVT